MSISVSEWVYEKYFPNRGNRSRWIEEMIVLGTECYSKDKTDETKKIVELTKLLREYQLQIGELTRTNKRLKSKRTGKVMRRITVIGK